jgi:uncharacterized Ntn-hydrolase superfamily protein
MTRSLLSYSLILVSIMCLAVKLPLSGHATGASVSRVGQTTSSESSSTPRRSPLVCTFSICGYDPDRKEWGVAVASKYLAVGAVVPWCEAEAGAVATQSYVNVSYGPRGLKMLAAGKSAEEVVAALTSADSGRERRQVGIVDARGETANFTGKECNPWAGAKSGKHYTCQGNLLTGPEVVEEMAKAFEASKGPLAWRLIAALEAGEKAGGDKRGRQSASILVVRERGGPGGLNDRSIDFRVDDHKEPIPELARILQLRLKRPAE